MQLLEAGLALERAHIGMFTELAILYSRHRPAKLMEHLGLYWSRLSISRVISACEAAYLWNEQVFLHFHNEEYDKVVQVMLEHSGVAFDHDRLSKALLKCGNTDTLYSVALCCHLHLLCLCLYTYRRFATMQRNSQNASTTCWHSSQTVSIRSRLSEYLRSSSCCRWQRAT